jgi:hypothetical protein
MHDLVEVLQHLKDCGGRLAQSTILRREYSSNCATGWAIVTPVLLAAANMSRTSLADRPCN